jgi:hypothetical protein
MRLLKAWHSFKPKLDGKKTRNRRNMEGDEPS